MSDTAVFQNQSSGVMGKFYNWVVDKLKYCKPALISVLIFSALCYMFCFTNVITNHDMIIYSESIGNAVPLGRWFLQLMDMTITAICLPWLWGALSIVCYAISVVLICDMFKIKGTVNQVLIAALIVSFPSLIATFSFMYTAFNYSFAFMIVVIGTRLVVHNLKFCPITAILYFISLAIYQVFITVGISLLVIYVIKRCLDNDSKTKTILIQILVFSLTSIVGIVLYSISVPISYEVAGTGINAYGASGSALETTYLERIGIMYQYFILNLFTGLNGIFDSPICVFANAVILVICLIMAVVCAVKIKGAPKKIIFIIMCLLIPLPMNGMYITAVPARVYCLLLYGYMTIYVFANTLLSVKYFKAQTVFSGLFFVAMGLTLCFNVYTANKCYLQEYMCYENSYATMNQISTQIKCTEGFDKDDKIAFIGAYNNTTIKDRFNSKLYGFDSNYLNDFTNIQGSSYLYAIPQFFKCYLGDTYNFATYEELNKLHENQEVINMKSYPSNGSIKKVDGYIIVKLSD